MRKNTLLIRKSEARKKLNDILQHPNTLLIIHYSSESFYDRPKGSAPRVTSIAIRHFESGQTISFSIHQAAEQIGVEYSEIDDKYTDIEEYMLKQFYEYVSKNSHHYWMHWNMRDINYGFIALEHRARVLKIEPIHINDDYKIDLAKLLVDIYGPNYAPHPHLTKIITLNSYTDKDFLSGDEEAQAFKNGEYVKLHFSTLRKVKIIANIAINTDTGKLKTCSSWWERNGSSIIGAVDAITNSWTFKILGIIGIIVSIIAGINTLFL